MANSDLYELSNGQIIEDEGMSAMMYKIMALKPHNTL